MSETMPMEHELKFLISHDLRRQMPQGYEEYPSLAIDQGYLAVGADGSEVRLRRANDLYYLTTKTKGGVSRGEWETSLTREQFDNQWPATEGKQVRKTRYKIPHGERVIELDIFSGRLIGLVMAEVEFESVAAAEAFVKPSWFGIEVSTRPEYKNQYLAINGLRH